MTGSHHIPLRRDLYFDINILPLIWAKFQNLTTKTGESKCLVRDYRNTINKSWLTSF